MATSIPNATEAGPSEYIGSQWVDTTTWEIYTVEGWTPGLKNGVGLGMVSGPMYHLDSNLRGKLALPAQGFPGSTLSMLQEPSRKMPSAGSIWELAFQPADGPVRIRVRVDGLYLLDPVWNKLGVACRVPDMHVLYGNVYPLDTFLRLFRPVNED